MSYVDLCGIAFSGTTTPEDGLVYTELTDWDGVADARGEGDPIPAGHGSYARSEVWRNSRAISMSAAILADDVDEYHRIRRRLEAIPSIGEMRVDQGDGLWVRRVEVDRVTIPDFRGGPAVEFTIDLVAPDPVRYSEVLTSGPAGVPARVGGLRFPARFPWNLGTYDRPVAAVENWGELPAYPKITVEGSGTSLTAHGGPDRVEFGAWDGEFVIDSRERRAFLNGVDVTRDLLRRDWPVIPAGETWEFLLSPDGVSADTVLSVEYQIGVW